MQAKVLEGAINFSIKNNFDLSAYSDIPITLDDVAIDDTLAPNLKPSNTSGEIQGFGESPTATQPLTEEEVQNLIEAGAFYIPQEAVSSSVTEEQAKEFRKLFTESYRDIKSKLTDKVLLFGEVLDEELTGIKSYIDLQKLPANEISTHEFQNGDMFYSILSSGKMVVIYHKSNSTYVLKPVEITYDNGDNSATTTFDIEICNVTEGIMYYYTNTSDFKLSRFKSFLRKTSPKYASMECEDFE